MITSLNSTDPFFTDQPQSDKLGSESVELLVVKFGNLKENFSHRLPNNFFQLIYLTSGSGLVTVDLERYEVNTQNFGFIRPGQIYQILWDKNACGYILRFSTEFLQTSVEKSIFFNQSTFIRFSDLSQIQVDIAFKEDMTPILQKMEREFNALIEKEQEIFRLEIISGLLKVIIVSLSEIIIGKQKTGLEISCVNNRFFLLLEKRYRSYKTATEYANELSVTRPYLNESLKKKTGFTTSHFIQQRIVNEAKRLTVYSDITLKEIAFQLGFEDLSHFSKFFKKVTGVTYTEYKKTALKPMSG